MSVVKRKSVEAMWWIDVWVWSEDGVLDVVEARTENLLKKATCRTSNSSF